MCFIKSCSYGNRESDYNKGISRTLNPTKKYHFLSVQQKDKFLARGNYDFLHTTSNAKG